MSFNRVALVPIGMLEKPAGNKLVFASGKDQERVSFDYRPEDSVYFRCRAITANQPNGNGDYFSEDELKSAYKTFIGVGLYKDHDSGSVDKAVGKVLWAEWIEDGKYVECYCSLDKKLAPELAHRVKTGIIDSVSMGCAVAEAECSVCGNIAHNVNELCLHMTPGGGVKGRKNPDGTTIYEINRGIQFNELSLVTIPADGTARVFEIYAAMNKAAADESNPLVRSKEAAYSNIFPENLQAHLDKLYQEKSKLDAAGDHSSQRYAKIISNINHLEDRAAAKELAGNYIRLVSPLHVLMYNQYEKLKSEGTEDKDNPFLRANQVREAFIEQLDAQEEESEGGRNPSRPGPYGVFLVWLMHSDLPDGVFGYRLSGDFKDYSGSEYSSVSARKTFAETFAHGSFPGQVTPKDFLENKKDVDAAFRESVISSVPTKLAARSLDPGVPGTTRKKMSSEKVKGLIRQYYEAIDKIQEIDIKYGRTGILNAPAEVRREREDLQNRSFYARHILRNVPAGPTVTKSIWDTILESNNEYLGLRKNDPDVKKFLGIKEPPKEAPDGREDLVGRPDAIRKYVEHKHSPIKKVIEKYEAQGLPLDRETLMRKVMKENGVDEAKYEEIVKSQGFSEPYAKVTKNFGDLLVDNHYKNTPWSKGLKLAFDRLLYSEPIVIPEGGTLSNLESEEEGADKLSDPWTRHYPNIKSDEDRRAARALALDKKDTKEGEKTDKTYGLKKDLFKMVRALYFTSVNHGRRMEDVDFSDLDPGKWNLNHLKAMGELNKQLPERLRKIEEKISEIRKKDPKSKNFDEAVLRNYLASKKASVDKSMAEFLSTERGQAAKAAHDQYQSNVQRHEEAKGLEKEVTVDDTAVMPGGGGDITYDEFIKLVNAVAIKILAVRPLFKGRAPAEIEVDWESLMENIGEFDRLIDSAPDSWRKSIFLESHNALTASRFAARWRRQAESRGSETKQHSRQESNAKAISEASNKVRQYVFIDKDSAEKLPEDQKAFIDSKLEEYAKNKAKIDALVSEYYAGSAIGAAQAWAIEYYLVLKELADHMHDIGYDSSVIDKDIEKAIEESTAKKEVSKDPVVKKVEMDDEGAKVETYEVIKDGATFTFNSKEEADSFLGLDKNKVNDSGDPFSRWHKADWDGTTFLFDSKEEADEFLESKRKEKEGEDPPQKITPTSGSVATMHNRSEAINMGLKINFTKGKTLKASYFEAKDGNAMYRVAASEVLPLVVQEAIVHNDPDVTTPESLIEDLQHKYASLQDFKRWAKRRRHKNRKALEKHKKPGVPDGTGPLAGTHKCHIGEKNFKSNAVESTGRKNEMSKAESLNKAAAEDKEVVTPVTEQAPAVKTTTDATQAPAATPEAAPAATETAVEAPSEVKEIKAAFETLLKFVEAKLNKEAVLTENIEPKIDGKGKPQVAPAPSGIKEVSKTESPKGHVSASLKVEAMDENWSVNEKELEAEPKKAKPAQSMPMLMSVDSKEVASEQMHAKVDNKAASTVKKYYNQLGSGATGEPAKAIDLKSSQNDEVLKLKAALEQAEAEKAALIAKANLNAVADKIYNVVATLRAKNLLPKGKEEAMVDTLTQKFANLDALEGLNTLLNDLNATETSEEEIDAPKVVPQTILESVQPQNEDAVTLLSKNWNK